MPTTIAKSCPKCGGACYLGDDPDSGPEWRCLQCAKEVSLDDMETLVMSRKPISTVDLLRLPVPPKPKFKKQGEKASFNYRKDLNSYHEKHRFRLTAEYLILGDKNLKARWDIKDTTLTGLKKRWKLPVFTWPSEIGVPSELRILARKFPKYPVFDNNWGGEVKVAWFNNYTRLLELNIEIEHLSSSPQGGDGHMGMAD